MPAHKNILLPGPHNKPILTDIFFEESPLPKPVILYAHGFNGFKDWGNFDLVARQFADAGFVLVKFNFSHNGTTQQQPETFADLESYAENNYTKELDDLGAVIDWAASEDNLFAEEMDAELIGLIGHSLGGGIVLLKAAEDKRVKALATWAAVSKCQTPWTGWPEEKLRRWKEEGVAHITNSRTGQELPLGYQLVEDFQNNAARLDIETAAKRLRIPALICHGTADTSVPVSSVHQLKDWMPAAKLFTVNSDHVFGRKHPWPDPQLPEAMQQVVGKTIAFFETALNADEEDPFLHTD